MVTTTGQLILNGLVTGAAYGVLAIGVGLLYKIAGFFQFTVASVYAVAAYAAVQMAGPGMAVSLAISVLASVFAATALALALETGLYGPLRARRAPPLVPMLASIGSVVVIENVSAILFGPGLLTARSAVGTVVSLGPWHLTELRIAQLAACTLTGAVLIAAIKRSGMGLTLRAVASDTVLASLQGIRTSASVRIATALSATAISVPAIFVAFDTGARPQLGNFPFLMAVAAVLVAGGHSPLRWMTAGLLMGVLQQLAILVLGARWADPAMFSVLCGALVLRHARRGVRGTS